MSDRIGPMAWGSQGQVFLGEDLMHTRDYSDETARVIDEEVERILREQEDRARRPAHQAPPRARPGRAGAARARDHRGLPTSSRLVQQGLEEVRRARHPRARAGINPSRLKASSPARSAVTAPANEALTTPSRSATTRIGTASIS